MLIPREGPRSHNLIVYLALLQAKVAAQERYHY